MRLRLPQPCTSGKYIMPGPKADPKNDNAVRLCLANPELSYSDALSQSGATFTKQALGARVRAARAAALADSDEAAPNRGRSPSKRLRARGAHASAPAPASPPACGSGKHKRRKLKLGERELPKGTNLNTRQKGKIRAHNLEVTANRTKAIKEASEESSEDEESTSE